MPHENHADDYYFGEEFEPELKPESKRMKCLDCLMSFDTPAGTWCLRFKGLVNEKMAEQCEDYIGQYLAEKD